MAGLCERSGGSNLQLVTSRLCVPSARNQCRAARMLSILDSKGCTSGLRTFPALSLSSSNLALPPNCSKSWFTCNRTAAVVLNARYNTAFACDWESTRRSLQSTVASHLCRDVTDVLLHFLADFILHGFLSRLLKHLEQRLEDLLVVALDDLHRKLVDRDVRTELIHGHVLLFCGCISMGKLRSNFSHRRRATHHLV